MRNKNILFVVPMLDTEGPSYGRDDLYNNWNDLLAAMRDMTERFRLERRDRSGQPMRFSWFILDWVGYREDDPSYAKRKQVSGFHQILDRYRTNVLSDATLAKSGDGLYWHYHHPPKDGSWGWNRNWGDSRWYEAVLNKKILERNFFSSVFRAGGYVEDDAASGWLERFIPFDYSNNSPAVKEGAYDWSRAPRDWLPYHPAANDYQSKGAMRRVIVRGLPVAAKGGSNTLTERDVVLAFELAAAGKQPILSYVTHDYYKSAMEEFALAHRFLEKVAKKFPTVHWEYRNALDAVRESLSLRSPPRLSLTVTKNKAKEFTIQANHQVFGGMPYVAVRYEDGREERVDVTKREEGSWQYNGQEAVAAIGTAANDAFGNTAIAVL